MFYAARDICSPVVLACHTCNMNRDSTLLEDYAEKVGKKIDFEYKYIYH